MALQSNLFRGSHFQPLPGLSFPAPSGALISSLFRALFPAASVVNTYTSSVALHFSLFQRSHFKPLQGLRLTLILMYQGLLMIMLNLFSEYIINIAAINRLIQDFLTVPLIFFFFFFCCHLKDCVSLIISICFGALIGRPDQLHISY